MVKFIAKCSNQVLCMKPQRPQVIDGIVIQVPGEHIRFENGEFETDDEQKVEFIRNHQFYGTQIFENKSTKGSKNEG